MDTTMTKWIRRCMNPIDSLQDIWPMIFCSTRIIGGKNCVAVTIFRDKFNFVTKKLKFNILQWKLCCRKKFCCKKISLTNFIRYDFNFAAKRSNLNMLQQKLCGCIKFHSKNFSVTNFIWGNFIFVAKKFKF